MTINQQQHSTHQSAEIRPGPRRANERDANANAMTPTVLSLQTTNRPKVDFSSDVAGASCTRYATSLTPLLTAGRPAGWPAYGTPSLAKW